MKKIAIAVLLSAVVAPAVAADNYVGLRVGQARTNMDNGTCCTAGAQSANPTGWGVFVGHDFNPNFALEAEYLNLGEIKSGDNSVKSTGFSVSGVGSFPINEQFSLFGKLGYAVITGKPGGPANWGDQNNRAVTYGLGGQFNVSPAVGIRLAWDRYHFNDTAWNGNANLVSIGALFKF
jgi:OmpA-OmpF porin, OOP family